MLNKWNVYEYLKGTHNLSSSDLESISKKELIEGIQEFSVKIKESNLDSLKYPFPSKNELINLPKERLIDSVQRIRKLYIKLL